MGIQKTDEYANIEAADTCYIRCPDRYSMLFPNGRKQQVEGSSMSFPYGPKQGGYPLNRRSADDFCNDMFNTPMSDDSKIWDAFRTNKVSVWPPTDPKQAADVAEVDLLNANKAKKRRDVAEADRLNAIKAKEGQEEAERTAAAENKRMQDTYTDLASKFEQQKAASDAKQTASDAQRVLDQQIEERRIAGIRDQNAAMKTGASPNPNLLPTSASPNPNLLPTSASPLIKSSSSGASSTIVSEESVVKKDTQWIDGIDNKYVIIGIIGLLFILLIKR